MTDTPPTPPPALPSHPTADAKSPFARTAAQFCAWSPLIAIGINIITGFGAAVMLLGIVLGIVALCGIPKHGRKGILIPSVIGLTINIGLIFLGMTAGAMVYKKAQALKAKAEQGQHQQLNTPK